MNNTFTLKFRFINVMRFFILVAFTGLLFFGLVSTKFIPTVDIEFHAAFDVILVVVTGLFLIQTMSFLIERTLEKRILIQNNQMETILNSAFFVTYLKSLDGKIIQANNLLSKLIGKPIDKILGTNSKNLYIENDFIDPEDKEIIKCKKSIRTDRQITLTNGELSWYQITKIPVFDKQNNVINIVVIFKNIDQEKNLEKRKKELIATLTHDLKSPILAQIRSIDLLLNEYFGKLTQLQFDIISQIKKSCEYSNYLVFNILDSYFYSNGKIILKPDNFDFVNLICDITDALQTILLEKEQKFVLNIPEKVEIYADKLQIKRVIVNLLNNAIKHGLKNSKIHIFVKENTDDIVFKVTNSCHNVDTDELKELFEKYKSKKFSTQGTGLGLYLSKQIINKHNGHIFAEPFSNTIYAITFNLPKKYDKNIKQNNDECSLFE